MTTPIGQSGQILQEKHLSVEQGNSWNASTHGTWYGAGGDPAANFDYAGYPYASFNSGPCRYPCMNFKAMYASSIIVVEYTFSFRNDSSAGYIRGRTFDLYGNVRKSPNAHCMGGGYHANTSEWSEIHFKDAFIAGTTNEMKLEIQVYLASAGTTYFGWSGSDSRVMSVKEVAV
tara:strand:+ start:131 stop:652 length:522 start_codon:yes stop_codon:yes gene_type:complete